MGKKDRDREDGEESSRRPGDWEQFRVLRVFSGVFWEEIVRRDLPSYRERWSRVTMEELNQELIAIAHALSLVR